MSLIPVLLILLAFPIVVLSNPLLNCHAGQMLKRGTDGQPDRCESCPTGMFNSEKQHREPQCLFCTLPDDPYLVEDKPCTSTHDTVFRCVDGFYQEQPGGDQCDVCANCALQDMFEVQPCSRNANSVCCPRKDMILMNGVCSAPAPGQLVCGQGEYLATDEASGRQACRQCPPGSTNRSLRHSNKNCERQEG